MIPSISKMLDGAKIGWTKCISFCAVSEKDSTVLIHFFFLILLYLDTGDMTTMKRDVALKNIAEDDKCAVIIVSILAGGVGKLIIYTQSRICGSYHYLH